MCSLAMFISKKGYDSMKADNLFIGIDSGTQGTKAVVFSESRGAIIAESYAGYELIENERGGREQNPEDWIAACRKVLAAVCGHKKVNPTHVRSIGVSGQQHGFVPLDSEGQVIRPAKLWCDTETAHECEVLTTALGGAEKVSSLIGNQIAAGFTASKIIWLKEHEPQNYERLHTVLLPHDYINFWLCGEAKTEFGDASGTAYFDVRNRVWSEEVLNAIDSTGKLKSCLPKLVESDSPCGLVLPEIAREFGFEGQVLVASGGGDNMMGAIGTGNVTEGIVTASLGTSGTIYAYSNTPIVDSGGELAAFCSSTGGWLPLICTMNVTVATERVRELLDLSLRRLNKAVSSSAVGSGGLILLPFFNGERTPALPNATATLAGITSQNCTAENVCRAAMEGVAYGLRYGLDVMRSCGINPQEIRLVGGGAKSDVWRQIVADIFGCPVVTLENKEAGAMGAALQSMWCWYNYSGSSVALSSFTDRYVKVKDESRREPGMSNGMLYNSLYEKYRSLEVALRQTY